MIGDGAITLRTLDSLIFVVVALALGNFVYTAFHGDHGAIATLAIEAEARDSAARLVALEQERAMLENRIARMGLNTVDLDILDETARDVLGLATPDERLLPPLIAGSALDD